MEITRGDTKYFKFQRHYCGGEVITEPPDKMFFTLKYDNNIEDFVLQKTLDYGIQFDPDDNYYYLVIGPDDTNNLPYGDYYYDIEIIKGSYKQTIAKGKIKLTEEVTFYGNEG